MPAWTDRTLNSELEVRCQCAHLLWGVLEPLAEQQCSGGVVKWSHESPAEAVRNALRGKEGLGSSEKGHVEGEVAAAAAAAGAGPSGATSSSGQRKADVVTALMWAEGPVRQATWPKVVCVGEVKRIPRLFEDEHTPVDLLAAYKDSGHIRHAQAREVVGQVCSERPGLPRRGLIADPPFALSTHCCAVRPRVFLLGCLRSGPHGHCALPLPQTHYGNKRVPMRCASCRSTHTCSCTTSAMAM